MKGLLKFITCGSVDDGKSTLIGHILYDAKLLYADQEKALELASASEIARILRTPAAIKIDTFSKGRVELHKFRIPDGSVLNGMQLMELGKLQTGVLICVVERGAHDVFIPSGSFTLLAGDRISFVAKPKTAYKFFHKIGVETNPVKRVLLIGGGRISYYLARQMLDFGCGSGRDTKYFLEDPEKIQESETETIILYRWNRKYPADHYFSIDLTQWKLMETTEFPGNSHEKITKEIVLKYMM